jgi:transcriptional regulator with XRE-family HTH domain
MKIPKVRSLRSNAQSQLALALVSSLEAGSAATVFATARLRRQLSREEVAHRSGITADQVLWLEEGRVYAFRNPEDALAAALLLASGLEIDNHEARELAGLPVLPRSIQPNPRGRLGVTSALAVIVVAAAIMLGYALSGPAGHVLPHKSAAPSLPAVWKVSVAVENGSGNVGYTRQVASRIAGFGYRISKVTPATKFDYQHTTVFYADTGKGKAIGKRLAEQLGVELLPLPDGTNPLRLVVIVGQANQGLH